MKTMMEVMAFANLHSETLLCVYLTASGAATKMTVQHLNTLLEKTSSYDKVSRGFASGVK
jgi:hypothetical protein